MIYELKSGLLLENGKPTGYELILPNYIDDGYHEDYLEEFKFPYLTVNTHNKWYNIYLVHEDNGVEKVHIPFYSNKSIEWQDHNINPEYFYEIAQYYDATIVQDAMVEVIRQWLSDVLEGDITKLHKYLPKGDI